MVEKIGALIYDGLMNPYAPLEEIRGEVARLRKRLADPNVEFSEFARSQLEEAIERGERWVRRREAREDHGAGA